MPEPLHGTKVLVLGVSGMLGHMLLRELSGAENLEVHGTARDAGTFADNCPPRLLSQVHTGIDIRDTRVVCQVLDAVQPDVVVNCVGVIKQAPRVDDAVNTIRVNSLFPHEMARECGTRGARLIHVSTDCVFSGQRGDYAEDDIADPCDLYGRSKLLGEVSDAPALTLRTSIIGHELGSQRSLVDWFLSQSGRVNGYTRAIYTGVTTNEFARLLREVVLPRRQLRGLLHVASKPINKYELLELIAREYDWVGELVPYEDFACDRSLRADALFAATGYRPPSWPEMVADMRRSVQRWLPEGAGHGSPVAPNGRGRRTR